MGSPGMLDSGHTSPIYEDAHKPGTLNPKPGTMAGTQIEVLQKAAAGFCDGHSSCLSALVS